MMGNNDVQEGQKGRRKMPKATKTKKDTEKTAKPKYFQVSIVEEYIVEAESPGFAEDYVLEEMGDNTQIARIKKYPQAAEFLKAGHAVMVGHFVCPS
jgi:hypothetical protein